MAGDRDVEGAVSRCKLISYSVPEGPPYYANGPTRTVRKCETHGFPMELAATDEMCPIGRIEDATDKAIKRIEASARTP
jgi:hypothetical protein